MVEKMKEIKTDNYLNKIAQDSPSKRGLLDKAIEGLKGVQETLNPILDGSPIGQSSILSRGLRSIQSDEYPRLSDFSRCLLKLMKNEISMFRRREWTRPGNLTKEIYDIFTKQGGVKLTPNEQELDTDSGEFAKFVMALKGVVEFMRSNYRNECSDPEFVLSMLSPSGPLGNPLDKEKTRKINISVKTAFNGFSALYNEAVDIMEYYRITGAHP